nr:Na+/H+ antiporter NhaC family protein [Halomonas sp. GT]
MATVNNVVFSVEAGSDHIDHIKTQVPIALSVALVSLCAYLLVGVRSASGDNILPFIVKLSFIRVF